MALDDPNTYRTRNEDVYSYHLFIRGTRRGSEPTVIQERGKRDIAEVSERGKINTKRRI